MTNIYIVTNNQKKLTTRSAEHLAKIIAEDIGVNSISYFSGADCQDPEKLLGLIENNPCIDQTIVFIQDDGNYTVFPYYDFVIIIELLKTGNYQLTSEAVNEVCSNDNL